jgi:hypothetical protein
MIRSRRPSLVKASLREFIVYSERVCRIFRVTRTNPRNACARTKHWQGLLKCNDHVLSQSCSAASGGCHADSSAVRVEFSTLLRMSHPAQRFAAPVLDYGPTFVLGRKRPCGFPVSGEVNNRKRLTHPSILLSCQNGRLKQHEPRPAEINSTTDSPKSPE